VRQISMRIPGEVMRSKGQNVPDPPLLSLPAILPAFPPLPLAAILAAAAAAAAAFFATAGLFLYDGAGYIFLTGGPAGVLTTAASVALCMVGIAPNEAKKPFFVFLTTA
jgi:hypothetical protein